MIFRYSRKIIVFLFNLKYLKYLSAFKFHFILKFFFFVVFFFFFCFFFFVLFFTRNTKKKNMKENMKKNILKYVWQGKYVMKNSCKMLNGTLNKNVYRNAENSEIFQSQCKNKICFIRTVVPAIIRSRAIFHNVFFLTILLIFTYINKISQFITNLKMFENYRVRQITFFGKCFEKNLLNISSNSFFYLNVQSFRLIMENNFIQMAASAGHAVTNTIGPISKHIIDCVQLYFTNGFTNIVL